MCSCRPVGFGWMQADLVTTGMQPVSLDGARSSFRRADEKVWRRGRRGDSPTHNLDRAVPGARRKRVLGHGAPIDRKDLALVLVQVCDGKLVDSQVKELDGAVAARDHQLVLVDLRPGQVVLGVVCQKLLLSYDALRRQPQHEELAVADDAKVCRRRHGHARVVVRRVLHRVRVEARRAELEHRRHGFLLLVLALEYPVSASGDRSTRGRLHCRSSCWRGCGDM